LKYEETFDMISSSVITECLNCGKTFEGIVLSCEGCNGIPILRLKDMKWKVRQGIPNIWRYQSMLPKFDRIVSLGEGLTPIRRLGNIGIKLESRNPSGSYADRASALIASYFLSAKPSSVVKINYSRDFAHSLASYLVGIAGIEVYLEDLNNVDADEVLYLTEMGANIKFGKGDSSLSYMNPLTIEGLKTIAFELVERGFTNGRIYVPAETGLLALSLWKGIEDLNEVGVSTELEVVAVYLEGTNPPDILRSVKQIRSIAVGREKALSELIELAKRGTKTKLISASPLAAAKEMGGKNSIVILTATSAKTSPLIGFKKSKLAKEILLVLREMGGGTAYEVWERLGKYTLRGGYKSLVSLERAGLVRSEYSVEGKRRKRKVYLSINEEKSSEP
jgi:threonine synthase